MSPGARLSRQGGFQTARRLGPLARTGGERRLSEQGSALDSRQRLCLGLLLDIPADPSLSPATLARLQQAHAVAEPEQPWRRAGPSAGAPSMMRAMLG